VAQRIEAHAGEEPPAPCKAEMVLQEYAGQPLFPAGAALQGHLAAGVIGAFVDSPTGMGEVPADGELVATDQAVRPLDRAACGLGGERRFTRGGRRAAIARNRGGKDAGAEAIGVPGDLENTPRSRGQSHAAAELTDT